MTLGFKFKYDRVTDPKFSKKRINLFQGGKFTVCFTAAVINGEFNIALHTTVDQYTGEQATAEVTIPNALPDQWHKVIVLMDRNNNKLTVLMNDQMAETELNFKPSQAVDMRMAKHGMGSKHATIYMDEIYYANYAQSGSELELLKRDMQLLLATPVTGSQVFPESINLAWRAPTKTSSKAKYSVILSKSPSFNKVLNSYKTDENSIVVPKLDDNTRYFWRVGRLVGKKYIYSKGINSFTTNSKIEPFKAVVRVRSDKLAKAEVGNNMFEDSIAGFVRPENKHAKFHFAKVSGPRLAPCFTRRITIHSIWTVKRF